MILPLFNFTEKVWKLSVKCVVFSSNFAWFSYFYRGKNSLSIEWCEFYWADFWHGLIAELLGEIFTHLPRIKIICVTWGRPWRDLLSVLRKKMVSFQKTLWLKREFDFQKACHSAFDCIRLLNRVVGGVHINLFGGGEWDTQAHAPKLRLQATQSGSKVSVSSEYSAQGSYARSISFRLFTKRPLILLRLRATRCLTSSFLRVRVFVAFISMWALIDVPSSMYWSIFRYFFWRRIRILLACLALTSIGGSPGSFPGIKTFSMSDKLSKGTLCWESCASRG